jgi:hypothetical protein
LELAPQGMGATSVGRRRRGHGIGDPGDGLNLILRKLDNKIVIISSLKAVSKRTALVLSNKAALFKISENAYLCTGDLALGLLHPSAYTGNNRKYKMSALIPFLVLDQTCEQVLAWINGKLTHAGFRVVQTFDLHVARLAHPNCPCPHHGTDGCNCQMIVVLVYGKQGDPATLVIHGQEEGASLSLGIPVDAHSNQPLELAIRRVLVPHNANQASPTEVAHETQTTV